MTINEVGENGKNGSRSADLVKALRDSTLREMDSLSARVEKLENRMWRVAVACIAGLTLAVGSVAGGALHIGKKLQQVDRHGGRLDRVEQALADRGRVIEALLERLGR